MKVRAMVAGDDAGVRAVFRSTLVLGDELPFSGPGADRYERLCLDWYLGPGRQDAAVAEDADGAIVGYALVCTAATPYNRWVRRHAATFAVMTTGGLAFRRYGPIERRFYRSRMTDGWYLWRSHAAAPLPAHAHINVLPDHRGARMGRALAGHVDARVRLAGLAGWYGEINAPAGRRAAALERLGGQIVLRAPNHTLSRLLGAPVERLTVARVLPPHDVVDAA